VDLAPVPKRGELQRPSPLNTPSTPSPSTSTSSSSPASVPTSGSNSLLPPARPPSASVPVTPDFAFGGRAGNKKRNKEASLSMYSLAPMNIAPKYVAGPKSPSGDNESGMTDEMYPVFEHLTTIVDCHIRMLTMFFERMAIYEENPVVGDIFSQNEELLLKYSVFCYLYDKNKTMIAEATKKPKTTFGQFAKQFESEQMLPLAAFLDEIPKRVPALQTMISEYLRNLSSDEEDYDLFVKLDKQVQQLTEEIAQRQKLQKNEEKDRKFGKPSQRNLLELFSH